MEIKKNGHKMKVTGYLFLAFAVVLAIMDISGLNKSENIMYYVQFWTGTGITLLFGNAAKRIVGGTQANKQNGAEK